LKKRLLLLTGSPGVGKTTILLKVVEELKAAGYCVGGMISREVRSGGNRIGFEITDIGSDKKGWLARVDQECGPRVGKYRVNMKDLESIGVQALIHAIKNRDVVAVDEVGPMELFSEEFQKGVKSAVESSKLVICIVHWKTGNKLADDMQAREDAETYVVTYENREYLHNTILERTMQFLTRTTTK